MKSDNECSLSITQVFLLKKDFFFSILSFMDIYKSNSKNWEPFEGLFKGRVEATRKKDEKGQR